MSTKGELVVLTQVSAPATSQLLVIPNDSAEYLVMVHLSAPATVNGVPTVTVNDANGTLATNCAILIGNRYAGLIFGDDCLAVFFREGTVANLSPNQSRTLSTRLGSQFTVVVGAGDAGVTSTLRVARRPNNDF